MFDDRFKNKFFYFFLAINDSLIYFGLGLVYLIFTYNVFNKFGFIISLILLALYCIGFLLSNSFEDDMLEEIKRKKIKEIMSEINKRQNEK